MVTIKTFRAKSVSDALAQIKRELGPDAVILHTRNYKAGGVLGVGASSITEITATSSMTLAERAPRPRHPRRAAQPMAVSAVSDVGRLDPSVEASASSVAATALAAGLGAPATPGGRLSRLGIDLPGDTLGPSSKDAREQLDTPVRDVARMITRPHAQAREDGLAGVLRHEIDALKRMVGQVLRHSSAPAAHAGTPEALVNEYTKLIEAEVAAEIAEGVIGAVRDELAPPDRQDPLAVREAVIRQLSSHIPVWEAPPMLAKGRDGRPMTIALVGPTGVGKTTTIAKLAATYKLRHGKKVGLVTCDTYRIAAVDQLRTYANIIGLPLRVALTPAEVAQSLEALADCDVVLIDTAGRSPNDTGRLDELRKFIEAACPDQVHLVLSSAASQSVLMESAKRFAPIGPQHVIFTKLDEAVNFGVLVNVAKRVDASLSFITTGQEVPDHIEVGQADRLARMVVSGSLER